MYLIKFYTMIINMIIWTVNAYQSMTSRHYFCSSLKQNIVPFFMTGSRFIYFFYDDSAVGVPVVIFTGKYMVR